MTNRGRSWTDDQVFRFRRAAPVRAVDRWILGILLFLGIQSVVVFAIWWFRREHVGEALLYVLLSAATWYGVFRILVGWYNYFHIDQPDPKPAPEGLSVAIFITSTPGEPYAMFERTLAAARAIRYPHTTYLLDDTRDSRFARLAHAMGAVHLELLDVPGAKAGKINAALEMTTEEIVLVLDPDHVPFPEFLDRVLGYFEDASVGFVQVAQAYSNPRRSFVARAAAEQTYAFYGPILQGMHGSGTTVAIGANCTFRRAALDSSGGHGIGLAEDLVTAIRLHAAGWKSVYVPEIVSRGLVPEDLDSFLRQQLKWSRGVYEVLFREYPRLFRKLTFHQKLAYFMIGTYYLAGLTTPIYLLVPLAYLVANQRAAVMFLAEYVRHAIPVGVFGVATYLYAQRWLCDRDRERGLHWRGTLLKIGCWSVYLKGFLLAVFDVTVPYIPTAKERKSGNFWKLAAVPLITVAVSVLAISWMVFRRLFLMAESEVRITTEIAIGMSLFLIVSSVLMSGRIYAAWKSRE